MMAAAKTLKELGEERDLYLFDTFQGMSEPTASDVDLHGVRADVLLKNEPPAAALAWPAAQRRAPRPARVPA
jgi:hypothetical protein